MKAWLLLLVGTVAISGCGDGQGSAAPTSAATSASSASSASSGGGGGADHCLAIAGAKRARRPDEPAKITAQHILVKYAGAKKAAANITRTREQACLRAEEARAKLEQGMSFADVVSAYS